MRFVSDINGDQVNLCAVYKIVASEADVAGVFQVRGYFNSSAVGDGSDYVVLADGFATLEQARAAVKSVHGEKDEPKPEKPEKVAKDHSKKPFK